MTLRDESNPVGPTPEGPIPVLELTPGIARTGPWIVSEGQWALFACEVLSRVGREPVDLTIEVETRDRDEPDAAATELLPLSLDGGPWRVDGVGVHGAEFVRLRELVRFRWCSRTPLMLRMLPARWHALPDGFVWTSPWIPRGPSSPARIQVRFDPPAEAADAGSSDTLHASVVLDREVP